MTNTGFLNSQVSSKAKGVKIVKTCKIFPFGCREPALSFKLWCMCPFDNHKSLSIFRIRLGIIRGLWKTHPEIGLAQDMKIEISKKWMSFPAFANKVKVTVIAFGPPCSVQARPVI